MMTLPTLTPLTTQDRARMALHRLQTTADALEGQALLSYRMALGELRDWANDYGDAAALAMAVFQLEQAVGEQAAPN